MRSLPASDAALGILAIVALLTPSDMLVSALGMRRGSNAIGRELMADDLAAAHALTLGADADVATWDAADESAFERLMTYAQQLNGTGNCMGLNKKMCNPCPSLEFNDCKKVEAQCDKVRLASPPCGSTLAYPLPFAAALLLAHVPDADVAV